MRKTVLVAIADGIEEIESVCVIDTLRRAGAEVTVASVDSLQVTASRGVKLVADKLIGDCEGETFDLIVLPGGMPGAEHLRDCAALAEMLKAQKAAGRMYGAICASPAVVLGRHGLLDDKRATCHPALADKLVCREASEGRVVTDGNCVTSRGPGTALEFALELVRQLFGDERMRQVAEPMLAG
ncbi:MAG TPA: DJ-1/PfpI family protein [Anaerohalosphaeraceae bacterium]|jgi:4-methyl-5(b-hydroxyethyl)-thiazole monophosphate biosynthesis|nr:DJ-1/PfpI family protein [Anaerohalosphaeraceae bacterium]HRT50401.1 DJ-1/PfpI family protein [Anaerohalosphaeraceae bacterium]HRT86331.1 DJ-1/PfpI family protein [Anaerohalosphaeraceae bacterium]